MTEPAHQNDAEPSTVCAHDDTPTAPFPDPGRGPTRLLLDPLFGPYIFGKFVGTAGMWVFSISAAIVAFELTRSAFVVGLVSIAQFAPQLVLAPLSGALADRGDRRLQIVLGRLLVVLGSGGLAAWLAATGVDDLPGAWPVLLASMVVGLGFVVGGPAMNALVPTLVRPHELPAAIGLNNVPITVARTVGPVVGATLTSAVSPAAAFAVAALANAVFALAVMALPIPRRVSAPAGSDRRVRAGLHHLRRDPTLVVLLGGVVAVAFGSDPAITLAPSLSAELGHGTDLVGLLTSAFGLGAITSFPLMGLVRRRFGEPIVTTGGLWLLAVGLLLAAPAPSAALACIALAVAGAGMMMSLTSLSTQIQMRLPDFIRGRVMALWAVAFLGSRPLASGFDGLVADLLSVDAALIAVALLVAVAAWLSRPARIAPTPFRLD